MTAEGAAPRHEVGFLLVPDFPMLTFFLAVETLRVANRAAGAPIYGWRVYSADGEGVPASNGMTVTAEQSIKAVRRVPLLFVCSDINAEGYARRGLLQALRRLARHGTRLGSIDSGAFLLARAGLLNGYRVTVHWEGLGSFRESFPEVEVTEDLYLFDRDRVTCAGGLATFDMILELIAQDAGRDLAARVADILIQSHVRPASEYQRAAAQTALGLHDPRLVEAIAVMEDNLDEPLSVEEIEAQTGISRRQMQRLFRLHLQDTPMGYYLKLRLQRARRLLMGTNLSILEVELACGFSSPSVFSRAYKKLFGRSPRADRRLMREETSLGALMLAGSQVTVGGGFGKPLAS